MTISLITTSTIINELILEEGGRTSNPLDKGGRTIYGISEKFHPEMWKNGPPSLDQARVFYTNTYVDGPGFSKLSDPHLEAQLVDFSVNSGTTTAIKHLQTILSLPQDGVLGPQTLLAISTFPSLPLLNNLLMAERIKLIGNIVHSDPAQATFLNGWLLRALSFMV